MELESIRVATREELGRRLISARNNERQIQEALESFRIFLRGQWAFKEAF
jgi:hypothetical protein